MALKSATSEAKLWAPTQAMRISQLELRLSERDPRERSKKA